jgi:hypothetical protein
METKSTFQQALEAVKAHSTELLVEYGVKLPEEGSYHRIIENALIGIFSEIQAEVEGYNDSMDGSPDSIILDEF